ncbi:MAG: FG-GAP-like repeat-containing protein [Planctomycetota bacterium]
MPGTKSAPAQRGRLGHKVIRHGVRALWALVVTSTLVPTLAGQSLIYRFFGAEGDVLGTGVAFVGDLDGDGYDDIAGGARDAGVGNEVGMIRAWSGRTGGVLWSYYGSAAVDYLGSSVSAAGDVDGDGFADVIGGAPFESGSLAPGLARLLSGRDGSLLRTFSGDGRGDQFGRAVAGGGDLDGDGFCDVVVGAPFGDANGFDSGYVRAFSGRSGQTLWTVAGEAVSDRFGLAVANAGDVNRDGFDDVIVGASVPSRAYVLSGRDGTRIWLLSGATNSSFGSAVGGAGDVDRDGYPDLVVGAPMAAAPGAQAGEARLYSGRTGLQIRIVATGNTNDRLGTSVSCAGDVDGDGHDDVLVGSILSDLPTTDAGSVRVFSGADGSSLWTFLGPMTQSAFGTSVAGGGDIDGDGYAEIAVGAPSDATAASHAGSISVHDMLRSGTPAIARRVGAGCVGSNGHLPRIGAIDRPFLGRSFTLTLRGGRALAPVVLDLGLPIELPLAGLGMPGCTLRASTGLFAFVHTTDAFGMVQGAAIPVPNDTTLIGATLAAQWVCIDAGANLLGLTLSDALMLRLGS